jgi:CHAT domain-containing protein/Tfp pilus assembly protein PilF
MLIVPLISILSLLDSALVLQARAQPDSLRAALSRSFAAAALSANERDRSAQLLRAHSLANAYATAWNDSFFVRQVARFEALQPSQRKTRVFADSLRLAGNAALGREGVPKAMTLWRESLRRAVLINDPAAIAPSLIAIGAGFYRNQQFDSATIYLERGKTLAMQIGDLRTTGNALGILASVSKDRGDPSKAAELYSRASTIRARSGDSRGVAADQNNLGLIAQERGDLSAATRAFEKALTLNRRDGRKSLVALNLSNLALIASSTSDYARADSLYRQSLALERELGDIAETAITLASLGELQMRRGDYKEAQLTLGDALRIDESSGAMIEAIAVRNDLAELKAATGDPEDALKILRDAERDLNTMNAPNDLRAQLSLTRADLAIQFGTFDEANAEYVRAEKLSSGAKALQAKQGRALLLHLRGDESGALALLDSGRKSWSGRSGALSQLFFAEVQSERGDIVAAQRALNRAQQSLHALGDAVGEAAAFNALGDLALRHRSSRDAEQSYRLGIATLGKRPATDVSWRLHSGLAEALRQNGELDAAEKEFNSAIALTEQTAGRIRLEERKSGFLADKWGVYTQLAMLDQARGRPAEAFAVSERMRARQMLDLLGRGSVATPHVASQQEQDLRRRIDELTRELEARGSQLSATREPALISRSDEAIRADLDTAQKAYTRLLIQLRESAPDYARFISPRTLSWRSVASRLKPDEVLLEYLLSDSASTVFVVTRDTVAAIDLHVTHDALANLVEFARRTIEKPGASSTELWRIPLRRLYLDLIQPVEQRGYLRGKRTLVIAPHSELHFLPFGALIQSGRADHFLIEQMQVLYTPSASAWVQLSARPQVQPRQNVLAFAPRVDRLPASRDEVLAIGRIYGSGATIRIGSQASERELRRDLPRAGTVHLATFGVLNKHNPLFSFVELAPSGQDDGHLEVNEVFGLGLKGQLVVLSACQTALGSGAIADVPPGDDWVGLVEAFLQAGAGSVLASLWPVDDRATATLMEEFHKRAAKGQAPIAALAEAQRILLRNPRTARPFYWAGFVVNGSATKR